MKKILSLTASLILIITGSIIGAAMPTGVVHADSGKIYVSPFSSAVQQDQSVTITVRIDPIVPVDGVQGSLMYDSNRLQYIGYSDASSAFPYALKQPTSGNLSFARGSLNGEVSNDSAIISFTFKALEGGGSTSFGLSGNATNGGAYTNPMLEGAFVNFYGPRIVPPTSTSGTTNSTSSGNGSPKGSSASTPSQSTPQAPGAASNSSSTNPSVSGIPNRSTIGFTSAVLHFTTPTASKVYIIFGLNASALNYSTAPDALGFEHDVLLSGDNLTPGETYYYRVVTIDQSGQTTESDIESLQLRGMNIKVAIHDLMGQPLKHIKIELHSKIQTTTTDDKGYATFTNIIPGHHTIIYTSGKRQYTQAIDVADNVVASGQVETAPLQQFSVTFNRLSNTSLVRLSIAIPAVLATLGCAFIIIKWRRAAARIHFDIASIDKQQVVISPEISHDIQDAANLQHSEAEGQKLTYNENWRQHEVGSDRKRVITSLVIIFGTIAFMTLEGGNLTGFGATSGTGKLPANNTYSIAESTTVASVYPGPYQPADLNQDGGVNLLDFSLLASNFGKPASASTNSRADINGDGWVNMPDFDELTHEYGG